MNRTLDFMHVAGKWCRARGVVLEVSVEGHYWKFTHQSQDRRKPHVAEWWPERWTLAFDGKYKTRAVSMAAEWSAVARCLTDRWNLIEEAACLSTG